MNCPLRPIDSQHAVVTMSTEPDVVPDGAAPGSSPICQGLFSFLGIVACDVCEGTGEATEEAVREWEAWAVARFDQLDAGIRDGSVVVP